MKQLSYTPLIPTEDGNAYMDDKGKIWQHLNSKQKKFCKEYLEIAASERDAISLETHLSTLHDLREEAKDQGQISAAITAEVHRGKAGGLYIDRREILTAKIDLMSKDDILDRLENLIKKRTLDAKVVEGEVSAD
jgi:hypothetical protein